MNESIEILNAVSIVAFILSIAILITFFVIAARLRAIKNSTEILAELEMAKPENQKKVECKCGKTYSASKLKKGKFTCPHCKETIEL
jgi:hypothetical protein